MKKLKSFKTLKNKLWKLTSEIVRRKEKGICYTCGVQKPWREQHCGHFLHQAKTSSIAYEQKILHCQCVKCNTFSGGNLIEYTLKMIRKYGIKQVQKWKRESKKPYKWKRDELEEKIEKCKKQLKRIDHI